MPFGDTNVNPSAICVSGALQLYDNFQMRLLTAAAPPSGGEVFLWVDESARNVAPLPGLKQATGRYLPVCNYDGGCVVTWSCVFTAVQVFAYP